MTRGALRVIVVLAAATLICAQHGGHQSKEGAHHAVRAEAATDGDSDAMAHAIDRWVPESARMVLVQTIDHKSFLLALATVALGVLARKHDAIQRPVVDVWRKICFMILLPAFLLQHIWLCHLDTSLYAVGGWSFAAHSVWFAISGRLSQASQKDRALKGWTMMMSQGTMNSFLYPLLLRTPGFGEKSMACAVLWDLGGNMWICQFALFSIAAYFRPSSDEPPPLDLREVNVNEEDDAIPLKLFPKDLDAEAGLMNVDAPKLARSDSEESTGAPKTIILNAVRQPILIACILGFSLNILSVPQPAAINWTLWSIGEPYKLVLYFIVGYYGDCQLATGDVGLLGKALGIRYAISALMIALVLVAFPYEQMYRYTVALAILSPTSSLLIYLVGEHGYGDRLLRLTICGAFVSTMMSTVAQRSLIALMA